MRIILLVNITFVRQTMRIPIEVEQTLINTIYNLEFRQQIHIFFCFLLLSKVAHALIKCERHFPINYIRTSNGLCQCTI